MAAADEASHSASTMSGRCFFPAQSGTETPTPADHMSGSPPRFMYDGRGDEVGLQVPAGQVGARAGLAPSRGPPPQLRGRRRGPARASPRPTGASGGGPGRAAASVGMGASGGRKRSWRSSREGGLLRRAIRGALLQEPRPLALRPEDVLLAGQARRIAGPGDFLDSFQVPICSSTSREVLACLEEVGVGAPHGGRQRQDGPVGAGRSPFGVLLRRSPRRAGASPGTGSAAATMNSRRVISISPSEGETPSFS